MYGGEIRSADISYFAKTQKGGEKLCLYQSSGRMEMRHIWAKSKSGQADEMEGKQRFTDISFKYSGLYLGISLCLSLILALFLWPTLFLLTSSATS